MRRFQESAGLEPDGDCDSATWSALVETEFELGTRLLCLRSPMMRGDDVGELQLRLGALGFDAGRVDGILGPMTRSAVAEFQRNAGLVCDEVCGPETVAALHRLEGRGGDAPVTGVRERDRLRRRVATGTELHVAIGREARLAPATPVTAIADVDAATAMDASQHLVSGLAAGLSHWGASTALVEGPWSEQATAVNDAGADVYIGIVVTDDPVVEVAYFSTPGYESGVGRRLAEIVVRELPAAPGWSIGVVRGMRTPILRETRPPAVVVKLGTPSRLVQHADLVIASMQRAVQRWSTELD